jgi:hypothetical protein
MTMTAREALEITLTFFSEEALRAYPNMDRIEKRVLALRDSLNKHPDCEDHCQLREHKGYDSCQRTGRCEYFYATRDSLPQEGALANFKMPFYPDECAAGSNLGSPRSVQNDTQRIAALERLYRAVMVHDRGHGRETFLLNQEQAAEALHTIARSDAVQSETVKPDTAKVPQNWAVFCGICGSKWSVPYHHPGKSLCDECVRKFAAPSPSGVEESK